jgi:hypothetical protein
VLVNLRDWMRQSSKPGPFPVFLMLSMQKMQASLWLFQAQMGRDACL